MKYGKPVLSSNVTSMPEILGDAPIYFSPLYESDIYKALNILCSSDYNILSNKSEAQYRIIARKQKEDLYKLIDLILK